MFFSFIETVSIQVAQCNCDKYCYIRPDSSPHTMAAQGKRWLELVTADYSFREDYVKFYIHSCQRLKAVTKILC